MHIADSLTVFERGWLSANAILLRGQHGAALVDSGYVTETHQTLEWLAQQLQGEPLQVLFNTHLHSDHCGGNAAIQAWAKDRSDLQTWIAASMANAVAEWDDAILGYQATGQQCAPFVFMHTFAPGMEVALGAAYWQIHAAAGHDPNMVMLFEPQSKVLLSADALWERSVGVIFPELEEQSGFDAAAQTLDCIERLAPLQVVPGHGAPFTDVRAALQVTRAKLDAFARDPQKHANYAAKVLLKFKLLEQRSMSIAALQSWASQTTLMERLNRLVNPASTPPLAEWLALLVEELVRAGAAERRQGLILDS